MKVWYLAHPVSAETPAGVLLNIHRAERWHRWLQLHSAFAADAIICPWLHTLDILDEHNPTDRERGVAMSCAVAARCHGVLLVGGRVSAGMKREALACLEAGGEVVDLTGSGEEPPEAKGVR